MSFGSASQPRGEGPTGHEISTGHGALILRPVIFAPSVIQGHCHVGRDHAAWAPADLRSLGQKATFGRVVPRGGVPVQSEQNFTRPLALRVGGVRRLVGRRREAQRGVGANRGTLPYLARALQLGQNPEPRRGTATKPLGAATGTKPVGTHPQWTHDATQLTYCEAVPSLRERGRGVAR